MKVFLRSVLSFLVWLILGSTAIAAEWDGKSPVWVNTGVCLDKIRLGIEDKWSQYETYNVEYRLGFKANEVDFVAIKIYKDYEGSSDVIYPDDFFDKNDPSRKAPPVCGADKIFWSIYVNGRKATFGIMEIKETKKEVNGKIISTERK